MHVAKKGLRVLGIAESFSSRETSILAGVVMRKDLRIDGVAFARISVGGLDATDGVLSIYHQLNRRDINCIFLGGCIIAWYNIIDPAEVARCSGLPVIAITYRESPGIRANITDLFPGDGDRLSRYDRLGERSPVALADGHVLYVRPFGIGLKEASILCRDYTLEGKVPEPLRVARLVARGAMRLSEGHRGEKYPGVRFSGNRES
ncbi:MAG: DUF99 family protein [Methanolinea sp.]|nr:DUF99 family protein [Methanolinea sp.]